MKNRGSSLTSVVLAVAAAVGVGVGGYFVLGGCSSCETDTTAAAASPVAALLVDESADSCCPSEVAAVETVALETSDHCDTDAKQAEGGECSSTTQAVALKDEACSTDKAAECETMTADDCGMKGAKEDCDMQDAENCPLKGTPECPLENADSEEAVELTNNDN